MIIHVQNDASIVECDIQGFEGGTTTVNGCSLLQCVHTCIIVQVVKLNILTCL